MAERISSLPAHRYKGAFTQGTLIRPAPAYWCVESLACRLLHPHCFQVPYLAYPTVLQQRGAGFACQILTLRLTITEVLLSDLPVWTPRHTASRIFAKHHSHLLPSV